jgi:chromosome segregation ATPase
MKISSLLREAPVGPALSLDNDLMQRAKLRFPGYDSQQALSLYIADKATQQQKTDAAQNNLINTQQNAIKSIGQELQDYEAQAQETDREVERLKQLSGTLTTGSADRQQKAKVSADELEKLQKDLKDLKSKPGMDPEKYKEIEQQISALANSSGAEDADVKKLQNLVNNIQSKANVNYDDVAAQLERTKQDLDSKEERFQKYIDKTDDYKKTSAEEIQKYADIVDGYKTKIDGFDNYMNTKAKEIEDMSNELSSTIRFAKPLIRQSSAIAAQNAIGNAQSSSQSASQNNTGFDLPDIEPEEVENQMDLSLDSDGDNTTTNKNESKIFELENRPIGPVLEWDQKTEEWLKQYLPIFVKDFKKKYNVALGNKHPTYNDHQIAYAIENHITDLFAQKENPITRRTLNNFFSWVKDDLFQQPPETSTVHMKQKAQDNLFSESLDKTYSRMLDNLIGLPYIKG